MFLLSLTPTCHDQSHWKIIIEEDKASRYSESILVHQSQSQAINLTSEYVQEKAFYVGFDVDLFNIVTMSRRVKYSLKGNSVKYSPLTPQQSRYQHWVDQVPLQQCLYKIPAHFLPAVRGDWACNHTPDATGWLSRLWFTQQTQLYQHKTVVCCSQLVAMLLRQSFDFLHQTVGSIYCMVFET